MPKQTDSSNVLVMTEQQWAQMFRRTMPKKKALEEAQEILEKKTGAVLVELKVTKMRPTEDTKFVRNVNGIWYSKYAVTQYGWDESRGDNTRRLLEPCLCSLCMEPITAQDIKERKYVAGDQTAKHWLCNIFTHRSEIDIPTNRPNQIYFNHRYWGSNSPPAYGLCLELPRDTSFLQAKNIAEKAWRWATESFPDLNEWKIMNRFWTKEEVQNLYPEYPLYIARLPKKRGKPLWVSVDEENQNA